jgi:hypothetical protein
VCSEECSPGKATVDLTIPQGTASSANSDLFDRFNAMVPHDSALNSTIASLTTAGEMKSGTNSSAGQFTIHVTWKSAPPQKIDFFPESMDNFNLTATEIRTEGNNTKIAFTLETLAGKPVSPSTLKAVVGYTPVEGDRRGINVRVPLLPAQAGKGS